MGSNGHHRGRAGRVDDSSEAVLAEFGLAGDDESWLARVGNAEAAPLDTLGSFTLIEEVGTGGQGVVYRAIDERTGRHVALKHIHAGSCARGSARYRFEREIEAAAGLNHPGIVTLFSHEQADGFAVISMEWVDGLPVTEWAACEGRQPREVVGLFVRICDAVAHAHQRGVIHRDLKPSNVLVDADGDPHVLDFGVAKVDAGAERATLTHSGQFLGTPAYASPEQVAGDQQGVDTRSDVYALGVMLYETLTGRMPYPVDGSIAEVFDGIRTAEPLRPSSIRAGLEREIDFVLLKTLAKDPDARYQSVAELERDLRRYVGGEPVEARGNGTLYRLGKTVRRHRGLTAAVVSLAVLGLGYVVAMPMLYRQARTEARKAQAVQRFLEHTLTSASPYQRDGELTLAHLLEEAARRADRDLADQPAVAADIHKTIARTYSGLWLWADAEEHARRAVDGYRALHGNRHAEVASCLNLLARAQAFQRKPTCLATVRDAVEIRRSLYGVSHPALAESLSTSGFARWNVLGEEDADRTESLYRRALEMYAETLDAPTVTWARAHYSFGSFLTAHRRFDEALGHLRRSVEMYRGFRERGERFYLARVLGAYALCQLELGDLESAQTATLEALETQPQGYVDWGTPRLYWSLGEIARRRGDAAQALARYDEMLAVSCEILARSGPASDTAWTRLARQFRGGDADDAAYGEAFARLVDRDEQGPAAMERRVGPVAEVLAQTGRPEAARRALDASVIRHEP